ncbi:MAG: phosphoribosylamine--glycine ligase [Chloroflexi bacterium]|nr:phosphoribosylamine--glycine ligase [Chloroflexota bacterium]
MKVLIVGSGGREHALAWRLQQSSDLTGLWVASGNAGTAGIATNIDVSPDDLDGISAAARSLRIDLVVVGPEIPLAAGLVDRLDSLGIPAFGPTQAAAQIESSKSFALEIMEEAGVPCPQFRTFRDQQLALDFLGSHQGPVVVKADGLAAGKGVLICDDRAAAVSAVQDCMSQRLYGDAGDTIVIQEFLTGPELSVFAFTDGEHLSPLVAACDYKRLGEGDHGPNTGGMGGFSPPEFWTDDLAMEVADRIMQPVIQAMSRRGMPYRGVLYAGLMLTAEGPKVLEFNCRFGDPEAQMVLPRLASDPLELMAGCVESRLSAVPVLWDAQDYVGIVMVSGGYPGNYSVGFEIAGLDAGLDARFNKEERGTIVFHAGTRVAPDSDQPTVVSSGGRVLTVVGRGGSLAEARATAYHRVEEISFQGAYYRTDIAAVEGRSAVWVPGPATPAG